MLKSWQCSTCQFHIIHQHIPWHLYVKCATCIITMLKFLDTPLMGIEHPTSRKWGRCTNRWVVWIDHFILFPFQFYWCFGNSYRLGSHLGIQKDLFCCKNIYGKGKEARTYLWERKIYFLKFFYAGKEQFYLFCCLGYWKSITKECYEFWWKSISENGQFSFSRTVGNANTIFLAY